MIATTLWACLAIALTGFGVAGLACCLMAGMKPSDFPPTGTDT